MSLIATITQQSERIGLFHYRVDQTVWRYVLEHADKTVTFVALWVDENYATMVLLEDERPVLISTAIEQRRYLGPSKRFPAAQWEERIARDLWGVEALSTDDDRTAIDDGCWSLTWPLARKPIPAQGNVEPAGYSSFFSPHCTAVPGLLGVRYDVTDDDHIKALEAYISPAHRGILSQLKGLTPVEALPLIGRISAAGFVAHPLAFMRAIEQAQAKIPSPRERDTRLIMLEIERISLYLFDMSSVARCVGAELLATHCDHAREALAQVCSKNGVSRRLTDIIRPLEEGCAVPEIVPFVQDFLTILTPYMSHIRGLHRVFSSRLEGVATVSTELAWMYGLGGVAGRASGRYIDMRFVDVGMRLDALPTSGRHEGDALARNGQRLSEIYDSLQLIKRILVSIGLENKVQNTPITDEGLGVVEGARGDVWYWVRLKQGKIEQIHVRDPALPVLAVLESILKKQPVHQLNTALCSLGISPAGAVL